IYPITSLQEMFSKNWVKDSRISDEVVNMTIFFMTWLTLSPFTRIETIALFPLVYLILVLFEHSAGVQKGSSDILFPLTWKAIQSLIKTGFYLGFIFSTLFFILDHLIASPIIVTIPILILALFFVQEEYRYLSAQNMWYTKSGGPVFESTSQKTPLAELKAIDPKYSSYINLDDKGKVQLKREMIRELIISPNLETEKGLDLDKTAVSINEFYTYLFTTEEDGKISKAEIWESFTNALYEDLTNEQNTNLIAGTRSSILGGFAAWGSKSNQDENISAQIKNLELVYQLVKPGSDLTKAASWAEQYKNNALFHKDRPQRMIMTVETEAEKTELENALNSQRNTFVKVLVRGNKSLADLHKEAQKLFTDLDETQFEKANISVLIEQGLKLPQEFFDIERARAFVLILNVLNPIMIEFNHNKIDDIDRIINLIESQA
ncbi:MAG: hypothetical protein ACKVQC_05915, partial [Elusimicrobiota bacterium]